MSSRTDEKIRNLEREIADLNEKLIDLGDELAGLQPEGGSFTVSGNTVTLRMVSEQVESALQQIWAIRRTLEREGITIAPTRQEMAQDARALELRQSEAAKRNE